jgi:hypothetical protein
MGLYLAGRKIREGDTDKDDFDVVSASLLFVVLTLQRPSLLAIRVLTIQPTEEEEKHYASFS